MKVAVIGAGIGGLALAQGLTRAGVDVTVYERDAALDSRRQGYRIHLHAAAALEVCLPPDLYELCLATAGQPSTQVTGGRLGPGRTARGGDGDRPALASRHPPIRRTCVREGNHPSSRSDLRCRSGPGRAPA